MLIWFVDTRERTRPSPFMPLTQLFARHSFIQMWFSATNLDIPLLAKLIGLRTLIDRLEAIAPPQRTIHFHQGQTGFKVDDGT
jgi:hypothetical protein